MRSLPIARSLRLALVALTIVLIAVAALGIASLYGARQRYENILKSSSSLSTAAANLAAAGIAEEQVLSDARGPAAERERLTARDDYQATPARLASSPRATPPASAWSRPRSPPNRVPATWPPAAGSRWPTPRAARWRRCAHFRPGSRSHQLRQSYMATVRALSNAVEARDAYTGKHAERVTAYGIEIARALGIPRAELGELEFGFLLHDIGKVAIADAILYKPAALTGEERALMAQHPLIGAEIVSGIEFLEEAAAVIRSHHERWDGHGYPEGLAGEEIPLAARVFSVADVLEP